MLKLVQIARFQPVPTDVGAAHDCDSERRVVSCLHLCLAWRRQRAHERIHHFAGAAAADGADRVRLQPQLPELGSLGG